MVSALIFQGLGLFLHSLRENMHFFCWSALFLFPSFLPNLHLLPSPANFLSPSCVQRGANLWHTPARRQRPSESLSVMTISPSFPDSPRIQVTWFPEKPYLSAFPSVTWALPKGLQLCRAFKKFHLVTFSFFKKLIYF